jgi:hypothetical protein
VLLERLSPEMRAALPVDAQGLAGAIDLVAEAAGLSPAQRRALVRPHAVNPAVMHARVFGGAPLTEETLMGSFVEGARVRADALANLPRSPRGSTRRPAATAPPSRRPSGAPSPGRSAAR